jgi:hypothetical protein
MRHERGGCGHEQRGKRANDEGTANQRDKRAATGPSRVTGHRTRRIERGCECLAESARGDACHNNQQLFFYSIPTFPTNPLPLLLPHVLLPLLTSTPLPPSPLPDVSNESGIAPPHPQTFPPIRSRLAGREPPLCPHSPAVPQHSPLSSLPNSHSHLLRLLFLHVR